MWMGQSQSEEIATSFGGTPVYGTGNTGLGWSLQHPTTGALPFGQAPSQDHPLPTQSPDQLI